jgi:hypothetical protein
MRRASSLSLALLPIVAALACGGKKVMVPPAIDLQQHEILGIIEFSSNSKGELGELTTTRFMEWARADQGLVRMIELGTEDEVLSNQSSRRLDPATYKAIGKDWEVATVFVGELEISDIRPTVSITTDLSALGAAADVDATLTVHMIETATGASIWNRSASVTKRVGHVSIFGGRDISFDAEDPERAYGELVDALVEAVTRDFRVSWART